MIYNHLHHQRDLRFALLFMMLFAGMTKSYAYDFSAVCETGQTLYYNITNADYHYVELTYPDNSGLAFHYWDGYEKPIGDIILPKYVYDANNDLYFVTSIGSDAFYGCSGMTSVVIGNYVTSIGSGAFYSCSGLTGELNIPNSVSSIGGQAFLYCSGLEQIVVGSGNTVYDSRNNCNAIIKTNTNELVVGCKNTIIPNTVTTICDYAFYYCRGLTSINIPNSVTTIGNRAFTNCSELTSVTIGNSVTKIDTWAFGYCSNLTSIIIPNSVTIIGSDAFGYCSGLTSVTIGNSVTTIGEGAFSWCGGLEQIVVESGNTVYDSRDNCNAIINTSTNELVVGCKNTVIPISVTTIGRAFEGCSGLTSITIPNTLTTIGSYAFTYCNGLTSINIPNSVTTIGFESFYGCSGLTSVTIGNSVTMIDALAFCGCGGLSSVVMLAITPPTLVHLSGMDNVFGTSNTLKIYVPYESLNAYKTATYWSDYESRIYPMAYKTISGYETSNGNWAFIASPLSANTAPTAIENMITETEYDLYRFDQAEDAEWQNFKANNFNLANGQGYLYANKEDVNLIFKGDFNEGSTKTINLIYEAGEPFAGWNLVGNPFPMAATVTGSSYYVMNAEGTQIDPIAVSSGGTIAPCTGIMVQATVLGQPITFTRESRQVSTNNGTLQIAVSQNNTRSNTVLDKAIVSFNEGDELGKFVFSKDNAKLYIPQGNEDYAIAYAEKQDEMPLNFEVKENGSYTISVNPESVEMTYLHLIDNMTGVDVDLLATPSYTFEAKTSDYASRFRLVFSNGDTDDDNEKPFAYISNGNIIVTGDYANATLQIVDMTGHVIVSTDVARNVYIANMTPGVYVLRLIDGEKVRAQKIVIE